MVAFLGIAVTAFALALAWVKETTCVVGLTCQPLYMAAQPNRRQVEMSVECS